MPETTYQRANDSLDNKLDLWVERFKRSFKEEFGTYPRMQVVAKMLEDEITDKKQKFIKDFFCDNHPIVIHEVLKKIEEKNQEVKRRGRPKKQ